MLRILVTLGLVVAAAPTLAGETLRIGSSASSGRRAARAGRAVAETAADPGAAS